MFKCLSECDKIVIILRLMFENFGYDDVSFKKESFFFWYDDVIGMLRLMVWLYGICIEMYYD